MLVRSEWFWYEGDNANPGLNNILKNMVRKERRSESRSGIAGKVWLQSIDSEEILCAKIMNFSASGIGISIDRFIPPRSYVVFRAMDGSLHGTASIRYCAWSKGRHRVGLELTGRKSVKK